MISFNYDTNSDNTLSFAFQASPKSRLSVSRDIKIVSRMISFFVGRIRRIHIRLRPAAQHFRMAPSTQMIVRRIQRNEFTRALRQEHSQQFRSSIHSFAYVSSRPRFRIQRFLLLHCFAFPFHNTSAYTYSLHRSRGFVSFPTPAFFTTLSSDIMAPKVMSDTAASTEMEDTSSSPSPHRKRTSAAAPTGTDAVKKRRSVAKNDNEPSGTPHIDSETSPSNDTKTKKGKAVSHQVLTDREDLQKLWNDDLARANGSYSKLFI
jgi:hypothetical protein